MTLEISPDLACWPSHIGLASSQADLRDRAALHGRGATSPTAQNRERGDGRDAQACACGGAKLALSLVWVAAGLFVRAVDAQPRRPRVRRFGVLMTTLETEAGLRPARPKHSMLRPRAGRIDAGVTAVLRQPGALMFGSSVDAITHGTRRASPLRRRTTALRWCAGRSAAAVALPGQTQRRLGWQSQETLARMLRRTVTSRRTVSLRAPTDRRGIAGRQVASLDEATPPFFYPAAGERCRPAKLPDGARPRRRRTIAAVRAARRAAGATFRTGRRPRSCCSRSAPRPSLMWPGVVGRARGDGAYGTIAARWRAGREIASASRARGDASEVLRLVVREGRGSRSRRGGGVPLAALAMTLLLSGCSRDQRDRCVRCLSEG